MVLRLLTILLSSWITTPLVLLFAQAHHFANLDVIKTVLLTLAAQTPLLVLFNECVTPSYLKMNRATPTWLITLASAAQGITIYLALLLSGHNGVAPITIIATVLATCSSVITLTEAERVNYAALTGALSYKRSIALGSIPSTILLLLYLGYYYLLPGVHSAWLLLHLILPALIYVSISKGLPKPSQHADHTGKAPVLMFSLAALVLLALTATNVQIRKELSENVPQYSSFILAALNLLSSVFLTFSRVNHIRRNTHDTGQFSIPSILPTLLVTGAIAAIPFSHNLAITTLKFLLIQATLIHALLKIRIIWHKGTHYNVP